MTASPNTLGLVDSESSSILGDLKNKNMKESDTRVMNWDYIAKLIHICYENKRDIEKIT